MSFTLLANSGSRLTLYVRTKCGLTLLRRRASETAPLLMPNCRASNRDVQPARPARGGAITKSAILFNGCGESPTFLLALMGLSERTLSDGGRKGRPLRA